VREKGGACYEKLENHIGAFWYFIHHYNASLGPDWTAQAWATKSAEARQALATMRLSFQVDKGMPSIETL